MNDFNRNDATDHGRARKSELRHLPVIMLQYNEDRKYWVHVGSLPAGSRHCTSSYRKSIDTLQSVERSGEESNIFVTALYPMQRACSITLRLTRRQKEREEEESANDIRATRPAANLALTRE